MRIKALYRFFLMGFFTIAGMLAVGFLRPQPISSSIQKDKFWATKVHSKNSYDVIFSGDSRVYRGIDPSSVSKELGGLQVLNFGFSSGGHNPFIFKEVEKRLNKKAKYKIIVLGLTPYSLTKKAQRNNHFKQEKERDLKEVFLRRYANPALSFFDPIHPSDILHINDTTQGYYETFKRDGWVESKKIPYNPKAALKGYVKNFKDNRVDAKVVEQVLYQVKNWTDQGIQVFALRIPTTKDMVDLENKLSGYKEDVLKNEFEKVGGHWIDCKNRYSSYDGSHLDGEAAKRFSSYLGEELSQFLE